MPTEAILGQYSPRILGGVTDPAAAQGSGDFCGTGGEGGPRGFLGTCGSGLEHVFWLRLKFTCLPSICNMQEVDFAGD